MYEPCTPLLPVVSYADEESACRTDSAMSVPPVTKPVVDCGVCPSHPTVGPGIPVPTAPVLVIDGPATVNVSAVPVQVVTEPTVVVAVGEPPVPHLPDTGQHFSILPGFGLLLAGVAALRVARRD